MSLNVPDYTNRFDNVRQWPIAPCAGPESPAEEDDPDVVQKCIREGLGVIALLLGGLDTKRVFQSDGNPDYFISERHSTFRLLLKVFLESAQTIEQVQNSIAGFIFHCINDMGQGSTRDEVMERLPADAQSKFPPPIDEDSLEMIVHGREVDQRQALILERERDWARLRLDYHNSAVSASASHWHGVEPRELFFHFTRVLSLQQHKRYAYEPNHDGLCALMSDTRFLFPAHTGNCEGGLTERKIPEEKRMTQRKVARLLQLPCLWDYIRCDEKMEDEAVGSSVAIIAEYFCENDKALYMNKITPFDIDEWMREKFERYSPNFHVASYIWARFLGTEFEATALWVEQYMLDKIETEKPWVFELAGTERSVCREPGQIFDVYRKAWEVAETAKDQEKAYDLSYIVPAKELLEASMGSKNYKNRDSIRALHARVSDPHLYLPDKYRSERFEEDFDGYCFDLFRENLSPLSEWIAIKGFELLDPMAIDRYAFSRGWVGLQDLLKKAIDKIKEMRPRDLLAFKATVVDRLPEKFKWKIQKVIEEIAEEWAAVTSFRDCGDEKLADMAANKHDGEMPRLVLPGDVPLEAFLGAKRTQEKRSALAEHAILERHLGGVRGGKALIEYLLSHRKTMMPAELVIPNAEAPNRDIAREYADSPDLLSLLSIATLLGYLGYTRDQIMDEVGVLADIADAEEHPDVTTVGAEQELVGATPEGKLIVNPVRFPWLSNVLAAGGDVNELITPPTVSGAMQRCLFALMTDTRFQFINAQVLWEMTARNEAKPSSIHLNLAVPREIPFSGDLVLKYMAPIQEMQWLANRHRVNKPEATRAMVMRKWKPCALLDILEDKHRDHKVEVRNLALDPDGDYGRQIEMLQLLGSAAIQYMKEKAGLPLSTNGIVMTEIYQRFRDESRIVLASSEDTNSQLAAQTLIEKYADLIRAELNRPRVKKKHGIIIVQ